MKTINEQKTALVTGASGGIGAALARLLAADGYNLVIVARSQKALEAMADELTRTFGVKVVVLVQDLSLPHAAEQVVAALEQASIQVDVLVNNAGFATYGPFSETSIATELEMMQLNMVALTQLTKLLLPGMLQQRAGKILNVASTAAFQPGPLMAVYYATKAYVLSLSEALANELRGSGVTVTALCPGPTRSSFQQRAQMEESRLVSGQIMEVEPVARAGYHGMLNGRTIVIPGFQNKAIAFAVRLLPRNLVTRLVRTAQERVQSPA